MGDRAIQSHFLAVVNTVQSLEGVPSVEGYFQGTIYMSAWITVPFLGANQIPLQYPIDSLNLYPESTILGCTDESACNYDEEATANNGTNVITPACLPSGCTTTYACNYDPLAEVDSDDCVFPEFGYDCEGNCQSDINGNGICDILEDVDYGP